MCWVGPAHIPRAGCYSRLGSLAGTQNSDRSRDVHLGVIAFQLNSESGKNAGPPTYPSRTYFSDQTIIPTSGLRRAPPLAVHLLNARPQLKAPPAPALSQRSCHCRHWCVNLINKNICSHAKTVYLSLGKTFILSKIFILSTYLPGFFW